MFLFWNRFSRTTCYDRYSFYSCGFVKSFGISFNRPSPFGFGVFNPLLTLCRRSMTFSFYFNILLRIVKDWRALIINIYLHIKYLYISARINLFIFVASYLNITVLIIITMYMLTMLCITHFTISGLNGFLEHYLNMYPYWGTEVGESSSSGAMNNGGNGGLPPQGNSPIPMPYLPPSDTPDNNTYDNNNTSDNPRQDNQNTNKNTFRTAEEEREHIKWHEQTAYNKDQARCSSTATYRTFYENNFNSQEQNVCPIWGDPIKDNGQCVHHNSAECVDQNTYNILCPTRMKGFFDPIRGTYKPLTRRQNCLNNNRSLYSDYADRLREDDLSQMVKKIKHLEKEACYSSKNVYKYQIKDLHLTYGQKQYLRDCMLRDGHLHGSGREIFRNRNIDFYYINPRIREYLIRSKNFRIDPKNPTTKEILKNLDEQAYRTAKSMLKNKSK